METKKPITLTQSEANHINRYIVDMTKHLPDNVLASAKWQKASTRALKSLGIN